MDTGCKMVEFRTQGVASKDFISSGGDWEVKMDGFETELCLLLVVEFEYLSRLRKFRCRLVVFIS